MSKDAYDAWVTGFHPSLDQELAMILWLQALEQSGPPPVVSTRDIGTVPLLEANGPGGERVTFSHNTAVIGIVDIRPWPKRPQNM